MPLYKNMIIKVTPILIVTSLLFVGCSNTNNAEPKKSSKEEVSKTESHADHTSEPKDIREQTNDASTLPSFLSAQEVQVQKIYQLAAQNVDLLKNIPCYCGCGESAGHTSNKDCFIYEVKENGNIVWDSHATTCLNCMEIAVESASLKQKGKTTLEIRKYIDEKYKEGYGKPTKTPMPTL